jgi:hypothetical protein
MKKLITIVALTATVIATPAFAQYNPGPTTGSASNRIERSIGRYVGDSTSQTVQRSDRQDGLQAFAMVPGNPAVATTNPNSPAATGGGSLGYNQELLIH